MQPERFTPEVVTSLKDGAHWSGQYQQRPSPEQGGIVKKQWWRFYVHEGQAKPDVCYVVPKKIR